jgi:hypothetical protein
MTLNNELTIARGINVFQAQGIQRSKRPIAVTSTIIEMSTKRRIRLKTMDNLSRGSELRIGRFQCRLNSSTGKFMAVMAAKKKRSDVIEEKSDAKALKAKKKERPKRATNANTAGKIRKRCFM